MQATEIKNAFLTGTNPNLLLHGNMHSKRDVEPKKTDVPLSGSTLADIQITDQFFRCVVKRLMKVEQLVAPTKLETMAFNEIETILKDLKNMLNFISMIINHHSEGHERIIKTLYMLLI